MPRAALEQHLGYWLRLVSNQVSHAFARALEAEGVSVAEWVILRQLADDDCQPPSLVAAQLGLTRGAVSKLADRLVAKRLIERTADEIDARSHRLSLTEAGRSKVPQLSAIADRNDEAFFGTLAADRRAALEAILRDLAARHGGAAPIE